MKRLHWLAVVGLLGVMLALMWGPMREDSVTLDEPVFIGAGYSYWTGRRHLFNVEHPPLMQLWSGLPLRFMRLNEPTGFFDESMAKTLNWKYEIIAPAPPPPPFYRYRVLEGGLYARHLLFKSGNDHDQIVFWSRLMQALVTLAAGMVLFGWARSVAGNMAGLLALATWGFNPMALAYGHLVITDPGMALMVPLAVWMFVRFLEQPGWGRAVVAGLAIGGALATKYTALLLAPMCGACLVLSWWRTRRLPVRLWIVPVVAWCVVLLVYFPHLAPPPAIGAAEAQRLAVPGWFTSLRLILVPGEYFKGLAILLQHVSTGHESYLAGKWSPTGWWHYFPVALLVKTPVALLLLLGGAVAASRRQLSFPLLAAAVYLGVAMLSNANIGVRHVLPVFPLLAVTLAVQYAKAARATKLVMWTLAGGLAITTLWAHPLYLQHAGELAGGPAVGHRWLVDSNFDWGQDAKRLKSFLDANGIEHVYTDYFGFGGALEQAGVKHTRVNAEQAREIRQSYLVVSATNLMRAKWDWLRESHEPVAVVAHTLFVYRLP